LGEDWQCNANIVRCWQTWPPDAAGDGCSMWCLCARRAAACAGSPRSEHKRARRRGRDRHERGKRLSEVGPSSQRQETQKDSATCRNDTKLPHTWAHVIVACAGVSISQIGSDTPLVLCQRRYRTFSDVASHQASDLTTTQYERTLPLLSLNGQVLCGGPFQ